MGQGVGTAFTYQGRLMDGANPANGSYDLQFALFDALSGGAQVGSPLVKSAIPVADGLFTVSLDFGAGVFAGDKRWLEIGVRPGGSGGEFTTLAPRQELTPTPNATFSATTGDPTVQRRSVSPTCPAGEYLRSIAADGTPTCSPDLDTNSGGTVMNVATGAGLTGGPITSTGTVSVASGGISSGMIAAGAVGLAQIDTSQVQARVSGCAEGMTIQQVNADGSVVCRAFSLPQPRFTTTTLDTTTFVWQSSMTVGSDGLGLISYFDGTYENLKVAHCLDVPCTSATLSTLDSTGNVGASPSVTIGSDGLGLISYYDTTNQDLKVAHCSNTACTSATLSTLDSTGNVGYWTSVTVGSDGLGLISYYDDDNQNLKVAHCSDTACTSATLSTLTSMGFDTIEQNTSVTIGSDGLGLVSYFDSTSNSLKVAHCLDTPCTSATISTLDTWIGNGGCTSLTIGSDGLGLISYFTYPGELRVAHCLDTPCTSASISTPHSWGWGDGFTSVTIGWDALGLISYSASGSLWVAHCSDIACTSATLNTLDSTGNVVLQKSVTIGSDGLGLISYQDNSNGHLKAAHCSNVLCSPFIRRR
jgi:hypothetical protein